MVVSYQKLAGHKDDDTAIDHSGLGIEGGDLVLDLLEGKRLSRGQTVSASHKGGGAG